MTLAQDALAAGRLSLAGHFGVAATYTHTDATTASCTVVVSERMDADAFAMVDIVAERMAEIVLRAADLTAIGDPARFARIAIASGDYAGDWRIERVQPLPGGDHQCTCSIMTIENTMADGAGERRDPLG